MKLAILVRHATAVEGDIELPDFDRILEKKGKQESSKIAKKFLSYHIHPDIWISSPAPRATETAEIFAKTFQFPVSKILPEKKLYTDNSAKAYMDLLHTIPEDQNSVIFFGHDPSISDFTALLIGKFEINFQKAGVVVIAIMNEYWKQIKGGDGFLTAIEFPKKDKKIPPLLSENLDRLLTLHNQQLISMIFPKYQKKLLKSMEGMTKKIVKRAVKIITEK
jgi:phosphohistidine phosphatase